MLAAGDVEHTLGIHPHRFCPTIQSGEHIPIIFRFFGIFFEYFAF